MTTLRDDAGRPISTDDILHYVGTLGYRVVPVTAEDDRVLSALERFWSRLQQEDGQVPGAIIEIGPGRESSCLSVGWDQAHPVIQLNLIRDGRKATGRELAERLLHQAAHALSFDPSRPPATEGRWHGTAYVKAASALGLDARPKDNGKRVAGTGYSQTSLARGTASRYQVEIAALNSALRAWSPTEQPKTRRESSRNPVLLQCRCQPPRRMRMQASTLSKGPVVCSICSEPFEPTVASAVS